MIFNEFSNNLKEDDFYLYTIAYEEDQLTENEFYETGDFKFGRSCIGI